MTLQEAIEMMEMIRDVGNGETAYKKCRQAIALDIAIECMEEVEQYRALGTVEELKEAREKQIPKKPIAKETKYTTISLCPICESTEIDDYCEKCGQKIDWGEEDEV